MIAPFYAQAVSIWWLVVPAAAFAVAYTVWAWRGRGE
jgi:hypothetical protein